MPITLTGDDSGSALPIVAVAKDGLAAADLTAPQRKWAEANGFDGAEGAVLLLPGDDGSPAAALYGTGDREGWPAGLLAGALAKKLPSGKWAFADDATPASAKALGLLLGSYSFDRYRSKTPDGCEVSLVVADETARRSAKNDYDAARLVRDLINTPTNDMGPGELEAAARQLAEAHGASVDVITGDDLMTRGFPAIHAVGRASASAPRLIDLRWGRDDAPMVTLVGKGVCFDTGGLDVKPAASMKLMKKDMGGAANVLGLAKMIMDRELPVRLRVLVPAVENSISGNAFRPSDVIATRKGISVEIGNTDAEGRLVLADALALAGEEEPELLIDMATLTGAARVALGPDVAPFYTEDASLAGELSGASEQLADPIWRMPLYQPYARKLSSKVADCNNVTSDAFAGSITAALFLQKFAGGAKRWAHFDIYGWNADTKPHAPVGGEAQAIRAIADVIGNRFGRG